MVTTWARRLVLMCWIMAARVVDLPLPVGPVTSTSPLGLAARARTTEGRPSSSMVGTVPRKRRMAPARRPAARYTFTRWRPPSGVVYEKSASRPASSSARRRGVSTGASNASTVASSSVSPQGTSWPRMRTAGAAPPVRCKSDAPSRRAPRISSSSVIAVPFSRAVSRCRRSGVAARRYRLRPLSPGAPGSHAGKWCAGFGPRSHKFGPRPPGR